MLHQNFQITETLETSFKTACTPSNSSNGKEIYGAKNHQNPGIEVTPSGTEAISIPRILILQPSAVILSTFLARQEWARTPPPPSKKDGKITTKTPCTCASLQSLPSPLFKLGAPLQASIHWSTVPTTSAWKLNARYQVPFLSRRHWGHWGLGANFEICPMHPFWCRASSVPSEHSRQSCWCRRHSSHQSPNLTK